MSHSVEPIHFCTSRDGTRIAYAISGAGPPLVWSSQWVHHLNFDWDSPVWRPWLSQLGRRHTLIRYDCRGCGLSDRDGLQFSFEKNFDDLAAIIEAVGLNRFVLLGQGGAGMACMAYAVRHPERVTHLILNGCPARGRLKRATTPEQVEEAQTRLKVFEIGWFNETPAYGHFITALHIPDGLPEEIRSYNDLIRQSSTPTNVLNLLRSYWEGDAQEIVPQIRCPTLVLQSRQDAVIPFEEGRSIASLIPGARFVPLESRNHILLRHEPAWQQFVEALDEFLPASLATSMNGTMTPSIEDLSPREREILELVAQGLDNNAIAGRLGTSPKTVRNQVSTIFNKLGANSRAQAVALARDAGFGDRKSHLKLVGDFR
jgi:pimeloyl-ACP methyl ester carboxylesterase/DNA-binding CsgD family transcriptional regulator